MINRDLYAPLNETKICAFRRGYADVDPAKPSQNFQDTELIVHTINRPWDHSEIYFAAFKWMKEMNVGQVATDYGVTYLDGSIYHNRFVFKRQEDLLAFRLKFPELT